MLRVLLDSAAQVNFISEKARELLDLEQADESYSYRYDAELHKNKPQCKVENNIQMQ